MQGSALREKKAKGYKNRSHNAVVGDTLSITGTRKRKKSIGGELGEIKG